MSKSKEVRINGCSIFFEQLEDMKSPSSSHDSNSTIGREALEWSNDALVSAARPLVDALESIHQAAVQYHPEKIELQMELMIAVNGETPVFKVLSVGSRAQISAKFVWKSH